MGKRISTLTIKDTQATPFTRAENLLPQLTGLKIRTVLPGGLASVAFRVYAPHFPVPDYLDAWFEVEVYDDDGVCAGGRIEDLTVGIDNQGEYWDVAAYGFGVNLDDQLYTSQDVSGLATNAIISNAITSLTQKIDTNTISATGVTLSAATAINLKMMTAADVARWVAQLGDSSNNPLLYYSYPQNDGDWEFTFKARPTTADLIAPLRPFERKQFGLVGRQLANRVVVQYNDGASTVTVNDTALQAAGPSGWGFIKAIRAFAPQITQAADATQLANAMLAAAKTKRMAAKSLVSRANVPFRDSNGQDVPLWRVRSGHLLEFSDLLPAAGGGLTYANSCLIAGTEYDHDSQTLTLTPENYDLTAEQELARVRRLLQGRHTI